MKKVLEVLQYGETDIRFNTDLRFGKDDHEKYVALLVGVAVSMVTKLWGGNEEDILKVIRALAIADLAVCVNRKNMIEYLDEDSHSLSMMLKDMTEQARKHGIIVKEFAPGVKPPKNS